MKVLNFVFSILGISLLMAGCSSLTSNAPPPEVVYKNYSAEQLYMSGHAALVRRNYGSAIRYFEGLDSLYPFDPYTEKGDLDLIYAYYQSDDYPSTVAAANRFIRLFPRDEHVDYAYYMRGLADFYQSRTFFQRYLPLNLAERDLSNAKLSFSDFRDLIHFFPHSIYAADARLRMIYLRNLFSLHELDIADYYMERKAYVAAANRATYIVQHFQRTPQVEPALAILVRANRALGLDESANNALRVLQLNFPNSPELRGLR
jgi:outer membrane protein assembly factor BamD